MGHQGGVERAEDAARAGLDPGGARARGRRAMRLGSAAHKALFCEALVETHRRYDPAELPWPELDETALGRLRGLPF
jgi:hypothetical protein